MKKIAIILFIIFTTNNIFAQVSIGKNETEKTGILDFSSENKGIIIPIAEIDKDNTYTNGTILIDKKDQKIKVFENEKWLEISEQGSFITQKDSNNKSISTAANINTSDEVGKGLIIGSETSSADGVLILESTTKALILPKVANPHINIVSPVAGTICYDTESNSLAAFDGKVWNYWK